MCHWKCGKTITWSVNHHKNRSFFFLLQLLITCSGRIFFDFIGVNGGMKMTEKDRKWKIAHWHSSISVVRWLDVISLNCFERDYIYVCMWVFYFSLSKILKNVSRKWLFSFNNWDYFASVFFRSTFRFVRCDRSTHKSWIRLKPKEKKNLHIFKFCDII